MEDYYGQVPLNETVKPHYVSGYSSKTGEREITLTFSEAIADIEPNMFIVRDSTGEIVSQTATNHSTDKTKLVLTFDENLSKNGRYTIDLRPGRVIQDLYGNSAVFNTISIYR